MDRFKGRCMGWLLKGESTNHETLNHESIDIGDLRTTGFGGVQLDLAISGDAFLTNLFHVTTTYTACDLSPVAHKPSNETFRIWLAAWKAASGASSLTSPFLNPDVHCIYVDTTDDGPENRPTWRRKRQHLDACPNVGMQVAPKNNSGQLRNFISVPILSVARLSLEIREKSKYYPHHVLQKCPQGNHTRYVKQK